MSSKARKNRELPEKDTVNIRRLVRDVMMYTLPKCGFPKTRVPSTDEKENVYRRVNFLEIAGVCTLRVALCMRDRWRRMFISRRNSSGFKAENISRFLETIAVCCPLSYSNTTQSIVNATFALCNEVILFFHHEDIDIDLDIVINATSKYVTDIINPFDSVKIELLFDGFDNITWYAGWIIDFITNYATPYGSSEEVSELFSEHVKMQWGVFKSNFPEKPPTSVLRGYLGFLPDHLFEAIALEDSSENLEEEPASTSPVDHEGQESPKPSESGGGGSFGRSHQSADISEQAAVDDENKNSSELAFDDDFGRLSLGAEGGSREEPSAVPGRKRSRKNSKKRRK